MKPAAIDIVRSERDLLGILALQRASRAPTADGFVTVEHDLPTLEAMHAAAPSIVARDEAGEVVAYALAMPIELRPLVPILEPMFELVASLPPGALSGVDDPRWYVMGQIAVAPPYRGSGLFDALYAEHKARYRERYDVIVTDVATRNHRSMRAHHRVGFRTVRTYRDATDEWAFLAWDWAD